MYRQRERYQHIAPPSVYNYHKLLWLLVTAGYYCPHVPRGQVCSLHAPHLSDCLGSGAQETIGGQCDNTERCSQPPRRSPTGSGAADPA